jgi:hypothetical protein
MSEMARRDVQRLAALVLLLVGILPGFFVNVPVMVVS